MRNGTVATFSALAVLATLSPCFAQGTNPEDDPLLDETVPAVPMEAAPQNAAPGALENAPLDESETPAAVAPDNQMPGASTRDENAMDGTVTIPRAVWEQLQRDVAELKKSRDAIAPTTTGAESATPAVVEAAGEAAPRGNRNYLTLPDISLILQAKGAFGSDRRDENRRRFNLSEGELGIQGYVYPNVKADAFLVAAPGEGESAQFEEGYLTFLGVRKGLNINVGRKFTPFGRTGELHNHSYLYARQLLPIQNLIAPEALTGDGFNVNYLLPNTGKLFVRSSFGVWSGQRSETQFNTTPGDPFFGGIGVGTGASFDRFYTGRIWTGYPLNDNTELELGVSHARGSSVIEDDLGGENRGRLKLNGADISYRHFMGGGKRLLLRGEYFGYRPSGLPTRRTNGYYALANLRFTPFKDIGLLYENSGFPQSPGDREKALSLIYTRQFTEQFYVRLMGTHGNRPGGSYNELRLQFTAGIGPHTHALE